MSFHFSLKDSLYNFLKEIIVLIMENSLLCLSKTVLIYAHFGSIVLLDIELLVDIIFHWQTLLFSFSNWNMSSFCLMVSMVSYEKLATNLIENTFYMTN